MSERTETSLEIETALGKVFAHVRGETALPIRNVTLSKRLKLSRQKFAERVGPNARAIQDWEQCSRFPDRAERVLLTVIDSDPEAIIRALTRPVD